MTVTLFRSHPRSSASPCCSIQHAGCDFHSCPRAARASSMVLRLLPILSGRGGRKMSSWAPVYKFVKLIPRGRVITYGGLAKALSLRGGARSAGRASAARPSCQGIPWHRVAGHGGKLLIREPYAGLQRKLLESEGVQMTERRVNMKLHGWTPVKKKIKTGIPRSNPSSRKKLKR